MKKSFALFLLWFSIHAFGQDQPLDKEIKENIRYFRDATVSFGIDTVLSYQDMSGKIVRKKIFYTIGTGVIFYLKASGIVMPCLITAKHIFTDPINNWKPRFLNIRFSRSDTLSIDKFFGDSLFLYGDKNLPAWWNHPDSTIDLACILFDPQRKYTLDTVRFLPYWTIPRDDEYYEGKEIHVLGYPSAVGLDLLNKAVLRRGIISWVPSDMNKNGSSILIDCNIFPGNSGGPVFSITKSAGTVLYDTIFPKPKFFGIVSQRRFSANPVSVNGNTIKDSKTGASILSLESVGIGVIITAKKVAELLDFAQKDIDKWVAEQKQ